MKYEDTICHKISECQSELKATIKSKTLNIEKISKLLQEIQSDAIHMETALKVNKKLRAKHNIDPEFRKMMKEKNTPQGVNQFGKIDEKNTDKPKFELTLKNHTGEIVYQHTSDSFLMCNVEKIEDIDENGVISGEVQTLAVGNDLAILYAFDQLRQKFASKFIEVGVKMESLIRSGHLKDGFFRKSLLSKINS